MVYFLALFIACSSNDKDQEDTQELETSTDWPPPEGDWQGVVACSDVRLLASNDSYDLALVLELDVYQAVISGESVEVTQSVESGPVLVIDEQIELAQSEDPADLGLWKYRRIPLQWHR